MNLTKHGDVQFVYVLPSSAFVGNNKEFSVKVLKFVEFRERVLYVCCMLYLVKT